MGLFQKLDHLTYNAILTLKLNEGNRGGIIISNLAHYMSNGLHFKVNLLLMKCLEQLPNGYLGVKGLRG